MAELSFEKAKKLLQNHNQQHLLRFWEQLSAQQQQGLLAQIAGLNLPQIDNWVREAVLKTASPVLKGGFKPAPYHKAAPAGEQQERLYAKAIATGKEKISRGGVAALVVAGGQGTRLGFDGPKGDFPISPVKNKTLFQLFAEQINAVSKKYGREMPWYVMTSPFNHQVTCEIFEKNDYYGLAPANVFIFRQGTLPNFSPDGKILLADKGTISCSPDGHGGSIKALYSSSALDNMKERGVEYISYFQVDNPLISIFDPLFVGLHVLDESEMSSKALRKTGPMEKVGNFCLIDGKVTVIEYSDLDEESAHAEKSDGSYIFELGSIAIHMISTDFVKRLNAEGFALLGSPPQDALRHHGLPLHRAVKEIPYIDQTGNRVEPSEPNGIKLESFVFDALPLAKNSMILETLRDREFAPVKNATGVDSAESARRMMVERWAGWLEDVGVTVPRKADGSVDANIEIAHSFALEPDDLKGKLNKIPEIKPGQSIYLE
jgi:UDP-N-acetylglucosamine/UDP-N-acetylgalactosamine diphosphorylase